MPKVGTCMQVYVGTLGVQKPTQIHGDWFSESHGFSSCRPLKHPMDSDLTSCDTFASVQVGTSTSAPPQADNHLIALSNWHRHSGIFLHGYDTLFQDVITQFVGTACGQSPTRFVLDVKQDGSQLLYTHLVTWVCFFLHVFNGDHKHQH